ncbi:hypothetical protein INT47_010050 [Mucor saturninus]|uniref:Uncharacterized protein n=1 Tax=Mucor saturninus TaxID=64648 RepID=A0A8H7UVH0_9FUNG|nr:hypothetical protein INT47_010050 [Mucor saturninus]
MKLTLSRTLYLISLSSLFASLCTADTHGELDECRKACSDFIPQIQKFAHGEAHPREEYENVIKYAWTTCQYKCYKCALNDGIRVMKGLSGIFDTLKKEPPYDQKYTNSLTRTLENTTSDCYNRWDAANQAGDTTSIFL